MPFYENDGLKLYYEEHGRGEPLVLVHGYGQDHTAWLDPLDDYARYFRTIIIDARGGGQSGVPEPGYKILDMVHDVTALMDHLKLDEIHFSGWSMGGAIGQEMAIHYPEKLLTLSLNLSWEGGPCPHMDRWVNIRSIVIAQNDPVVNVGTRIVSFFSPEWCNKNEDRVAQFIERANSNPYPMGEKAIQGHGQAVKSHDTRDRLHLIKGIPTLITCGSLDRSTLPSQSRYLHEHIEGSELHFIEEGGHFTPYSHPKEFVTITLGFLLKHAGRA